MDEIRIRVRRRFIQYLRSILFVSGMPIDESTTAVELVSFTFDTSVRDHVIDIERGLSSVIPLVVNNEGPWTQEEDSVWKNRAVPLKRTVGCHALVREACVLREVVVPKEFVGDWFFRYLPSGFQHGGTTIRVDVVRLGKSENCKFTIVGERVPQKHFSELWSMDHLFMMGKD